MTDDEDLRPWWASEPGAATDAADHDPLTRHRQARAGAADAAPQTDGEQRPAGGPTAGATDEPDGPTAASIPPWWGPAAEAVARLSEDLAASAAANAGAARGQRPWDEASDEAPPTGRSDPAGAADGTAGAADAAHLDVCGICPICVGLRALGSHRPELVSHLTEAARHLAAAVRSITETAPGHAGAGAAASEARPAGADDGLTRIDLDDLDDLDDLAGADVGEEPPPWGPDRG